MNQMLIINISNINKLEYIEYNGNYILEKFLLIIIYAMIIGAIIYFIQSIFFDS